MTEEQLTLYRLKLQVGIRDVALGEITRAVAAMPGGRLALVDWANRVRTAAQTQTVPGVSAAMSDLAAAEYQEALKEMLDGLGV